MHEPFTGGCACGAIRYEITAEPMMAGHCQCRDCQRETGTGHASFLAFANAALQLTGTPRFHHVKADSGNTNCRGFCPIAARLSSARTPVSPIWSPSTPAALMIPLCTSRSS